MKLAINTLGKELEPAADYCREQGLGIELADFAFPNVLDSDFDGLLHRNQKAAEGIDPISFHGPFFDLPVVTHDKKIREVCHLRHTTALSIAARLGASTYVAHTNYVALIRSPAYQKHFVTRMLDFWLPYADEAGKSNITIALENLWEETPEIQQELVEKANHPHLKASLDNGHCLIFSKIATADWVKALGPNLAHCHLHDNPGDRDRHQAVGTGKQNWPALIQALNDHACDALCVAEADKLEWNKQSIGFLRQIRNIA